jgi:hypothetical protein
MIPQIKIEIFIGIFTQPCTYSNIRYDRVPFYSIISEPEQELLKPLIVVVKD